MQQEMHLKRGELEYRRQVMLTLRGVNVELPDEFLNEHSKPTSSLEKDQDHQMFHVAELIGRECSDQ